MPAGRWAIYYAPPPGSELFEFGRSWLGRDPTSGRSVAQPFLQGISPERLREITAFPRRYGFHATLKPPFSLAKGRTREELKEALAEFALDQAPVLIPRLSLISMDGFCCLGLAQGSAGLTRLAGLCVTEFDGFREALTESEIQRRRAGGLTPAQEENLRRWGYPFVLAQWRFHMTLTGPLKEEERKRVLALVRPLVEPLLEKPILIKALSLFHQPSGGEPFRMVGRFPLGD